MPVSSARLTSGARSPTAGCSSIERSRGFDDEEQAGPKGHPAASGVPGYLTDRGPARRAAARRERPRASPVVTPSTRPTRMAGATRCRRHGTPRRRVTGAPPGAGACSSRTRAAASSRRHAAPGIPGIASSADVGQGVIDPRTAQGPEDDERVGPSFDGRPDRELRVRFVLSGRDPFDRHAGRLQRGEVVRADRVAVPYPDIDRQPEHARMPRAAVRGDDDLHLIRPAGPGDIERRASRGITVGQDRRPACH